MRKGHSLAVETSFTCTLSCTFPKSDKDHINSSLWYCCGEYIQNTHYFKKHFMAWHEDSHHFPLCFGKISGLSLSVLFKVYLLSRKNKQTNPKTNKPNTEAVVNSAAHCSSSSKYHSFKLWMFSPYHQELILWAISSFLAPEESTDSSQVIVLATLCESNIPHLPLTFLCLKQQVLQSVQSPAVNGASYSTALWFHLVLIATMLLL